eukprot:5156677-Alexandrium_andersonii.AAC.1
MKSPPQGGQQRRNRNTNPVEAWPEGERPKMQAAPPSPPTTTSAPRGGHRSCRGQRCNGRAQRR